MKYGIVIVENRVNRDLVMEHAKKHQFMLMAGTGMDWGIATFNFTDLKTLSDYNRLLTSKEFWQGIPFDKVLITQMDAEILRPGIEDFLEYDYVGAPWKFQQHGGNGGFSLRTKNSILDVIEYNPYKGESVHGYEDVYFSNVLKQFPSYGKLAPREVCEKFSCESIFALGTLGIHAIDKYLKPDQCETIRKQYK